jgi:hypothetical protein
MNSEQKKKSTPEFSDASTESIGSQVLDVTEPADLTTRPMPYRIPNPWPEGVPVPPPEPRQSAGPS